MLKKLTGRAGFSLVEVMVTVLITGIATSGLVAAYIAGINYWRSTSEVATLENEGNIIVNFIQEKASTSTGMWVTSVGGIPGSMLDIDYERRTSQSAWEIKNIQIYYVDQDHTLRMNDFSGTNGIFNLQILPMIPVRRTADEKPYLSVAHCEFITKDPEAPLNPVQGGYKLIQLNLSLENSRGDTLTFTRTFSSSNPPQN